MNREIEGEFETIASRALDDAEAIECSLVECAGGLKIMEQSIRERREEIEQEVRESK